MFLLKRPRNCPVCKKYVKEAKHTSIETYDPDGMPYLTDVLECPFCGARMSTITFGDQ